ncbi:MAG: hypothetical protein U9P72_02860 [Campylobacterota bacterium]|nr:hypothetical protein [Campylobacterota bacterium]
MGIGITYIIGYKKENSFNMPYLFASEKLICVGDSDSIFIIKE